MRALALGEAGGAGGGYFDFRRAGIDVPHTTLGIKIVAPSASPQKGSIGTPPLTPTSNPVGGIDSNTTAGVTITVTILYCTSYCTMIL